ncbi:MAG: hypothetical protein N2322_00040 [Terrimicrobiaceae bacterium]|nr:hypothetical protein [Terrimicrobiaceae bacterium]
MKHQALCALFAVLAGACMLPGCASKPQTMEQFERVYERALKRSEAQYRKYQRALEKAQARDAARES